MNPEARNAPVSFEEFRTLVARELQVEEGKVVPEASFVRDLLADSLKLVELLLRMEEAGINIPIEEAWDIETVGDAYGLYVKHATQSRGVRSLPLTP